MQRTVKISIGLAAVTILVLGALYYWREIREIPVKIAIAEQNVEVRIFGIGTVEAQVLSKVGFQIGGKIVAVTADQGDFVKTGTLLAKLEDDSQRAKLMKSEVAQRQAEATLKRAHAQRNRVDANYQQKKNINVRRQTLLGRGAASQEAADDAQAAEQAARSDVDVVEADAAIAEVAKDDAAAQYRIDAVLLAQHELRAPFDARVIARNKELGSITNAGEAVYTLVVPDSIWVKAYIDETLVGGLAVGQKAFVRLRSEANQLYETEVVRIDQEDDRVTEERRVYVRCRVCGTQHHLRFLGEQAEIEIVKQIIPSGLFIPLRIVEGYDGRSGVVWVLQNGRLAKRRMELGDRLIDGRIHVISAPPAEISIVIDKSPGMRVGRAARVAGD
jgi:HlyD family secretion protein